MTTSTGSPRLHPGQSLAQTTLENFYPGYFALVMATGIVSIGLFLLKWPTLAAVFLGINALFYVALWVTLIARIIRYPEIVWDDLHHHARGVTFLTLVAGNNLLGSQLAMILGWQGVARIFWFAGLCFWVLLIYTFFIVNIMKEPKPSLEKSISGAWLFIVVSTESIAVLGALIANISPDPHYIAFVSLCAYMVGGMFYFVLIGLILYRWLFISMKAETLTPPYWINMGAVAIISFAGSRLVLYAHNHESLSPWADFVQTFTLFFWAFATWWVPLLFIIFCYRHFIARIPLRYDPQYWSLVFPMGMYGVATFVYSEVPGFTFLRPLSGIFVTLAALTWIIVFIGLVIEVSLAVKQRKIE